MALPLLTSTGTLCLVGGLPLVDSVYVAGDVEFGTLTLAGQGGVPTTGASISSGDPSGHWTITGGKVVPTAAAVSANYSGAPYSLTFNDASTMTITCPADVRHVATLSEANAALAAAKSGGPVSGKTVRLRAGTYTGTFGGNGSAENIAQMTTFEADDVNNKPLISGKLFISGNSTSGNVTFKNLRIYRPDDPDQYQYFGFITSGTEAIVYLQGDVQMILDSCEIFSDFVPMGEGGRAYEKWPALRVIGQNHIIRNNDLHNIGGGLVFNAANSVFDGNTIHEYFADAVGIGGGTHNTVFKNNRMYHQGCANGTTYHSDFIQFSSPSGGFSGIVIEGNVGVRGNSGKDLEAASDPVPQTVSTATSLTLNGTHMNKVIRPTAAGVTITMPDPTLYTGATVRFSPTVAVDFTIAGTISGGNVTVTGSVQARTYGLYSDGTNWVKAQRGLWNMHELRHSVTLDATANLQCFFVDASAGDLTITLPPLASIANRISFTRGDLSANTVTILMNGSETYSYKGVPGFTSRTLGLQEAVNFDKGASAWNMRRNGRLSQGIFGNEYIYSDITVRGNIFYTDTNTYYQLENTWDGGTESFTGHHRVYNNTFLRYGPTDTNSDGLIDQDDGYTSTDFAPNIRFTGVFGAADADNFCVRNISAGNAVVEPGQTAYLGTGTPDENIRLLLGPGNGGDLKAAYDALMTSPAPANYMPDTPEEAIAIATQIASTTHGAAAYWDFTTGAKKIGATEPTIP